MIPSFFMCFSSDSSYLPGIRMPAGWPAFTGRFELSGFNGKLAPHDNGTLAERRGRKITGLRGMSSTTAGLPKQHSDLAPPFWPVTRFGSPQAHPLS